MTREFNDSVDGFTVDMYQAAFSGAVEIELPDARYMKYDDELLVVARVRVKMPRLKEAKNGDITRVNVLGLKDVALVRSEKLREHLCETLHLPLPEMELAQTLPFEDSVPDVTSETVEPEFEDSEPEQWGPPVDQPLEAVAFADHDLMSVDTKSNGDSVETLIAPTTRRDTVLANFLHGE